MFADRVEAGRQLANRLARYHQAEATIVCGIPRGGLVVAAEVANGLNLPLGIAAVRKIGAPGNSELAIGAVDDGSIQLLDERIGRELGMTGDDLARAAESARLRLLYWLAEMPPVPRPVMGGSVILVDDGVATGYTAEVAVHAMRRQGAARVVLAVPVAPADTARRLRSQVDDWICLEMPDPFYAVGNFFAAWPQVTDDQVRALLLSGNRM
ncbi:MAG TPA: phosphoribosyltransferase family protein [Candidatus Dormibacteraeota bacterium]